MRKCLVVPVGVLERHRFEVTKAGLTRLEAAKTRGDSDIKITIESTPSGWVYNTNRQNRLTKSCKTERGIATTMQLAVVKVCLAEGHF